jgi:hypothetical protein
LSNAAGRWKKIGRELRVFRAAIGCEKGLSMLGVRRKKSYGGCQGVWLGLVDEGEPSPTQQIYRKSGGVCVGRLTWENFGISLGCAGMARNLLERE